MRQLKTFGPLFIIAAAFLWSLDGFLRQNLFSLPATVIVFLEHFLGFILMVPLLFLGWKEIRKLDKATWLAVGWVVLLGGVLGTTLFTKALGYTNFISLSVVILLQKLQPVFAILLAYIVLKERLPKNFYAWAGLALAGGYLVTFPGLLPNLATGSQTGLAALLAVGAAFAWGSSTVFGKRSLQNLDFKTLTVLRFGLTSVVMGIIILSNGSSAAIQDVTLIQWRYLLGIVFSTGAVALFLYYYGLKMVKASVSTICELFWPVSAVFLDLFFRGTLLAPTQWLGAFVLLFAIYRVSAIQSKLA